jgi:hypothetical protein
MDVAVSIPDRIARHRGDSPQAIGRHVVEDVVAEPYRVGRLSHRQAGEALGPGTTGKSRPFSKSVVYR